jgi:hypothetical protein
MANQVDPDTVSGTTLEEGPAAPAADSELYRDEQYRDEQLARAEPGYARDPGHAHAAYHGRPVSWVAVSLILIGFVTGGLAMVFGPTWPVFWIGAGIVVVGSLLAVSTDMFDDWY